MPHRSAVGIVIGALNVLTGALMMWGGAREVEAYLGAEAWAAGIGALGFVAGATFAASGVALLLALPAGRRLLTVGALGSAVVHGAGVATGLIGIPGLILGVGYPLMAMIVARRQPPAAPAGDGTRTDVDAPTDRGGTLRFDARGV